MPGELKQVGGGWMWFADYVLSWGKWTVNCPTDRVCQVGMGFFIWGEPRGEKIRFSGAQAFTTVGAGAIHIRVADGKGSCPVRLDQGDVGLIPVVSQMPIPEG